MGDRSSESDGREARALSEAFERGVVARLPHDAWTLTDADLTAALRALAGAPVTTSRPAERSDSAGREAFGDMPVDTSHLAPPPGQPGTTPG